MPEVRTLILGGTGLLSTSVAQALIDRGDDVTLINRGRTPSRLSGSFRQCVGDLADAEGFTALVRCQSPWACVIDTISTPVTAPHVSAACAGCTRQLVFCSSSNVYTRPFLHHPVREDHPLGAQFASGTGKITCEEIHREAARRGDYALTVIRPGQICGEGGGVLHSLGQVSGFLDRMRQGKPVVVHGDGLGLWSALHADDIASIFASAACNPVAFGGTYNAMGEEWLTWDQYHERIAQVLEVTVPPLLHVPVEILCTIAPAAGDQARRTLQYPGIYDMSRARRDFGWKQRIPLIDGLRRTIGWLAAHDRIEPWDASPEYERIVSEWQAWRSRGAGA